jgi:hypothetical protein
VQRCLYSSPLRDDPSNIGRAAAATRSPASAEALAQRSRQRSGTNHRPLGRWPTQTRNCQTRALGDRMRQDCHRGSGQRAGTAVRCCLVVGNIQTILFVQKGNLFPRHCRRHEVKHTTLKRSYHELINVTIHFCPGIHFCILCKDLPPPEPFLVLWDAVLLHIAATSFARKPMLGGSETRTSSHT